MKKKLLSAGVGIVLGVIIIVLMLFLSGVLPRSIENTTMPPGYTLLTDGTVYNIDTPHGPYHTSWETVAGARSQAWSDYHYYEDKAADEVRIWFPVEPNPTPEGDE